MELQNLLAPLMALLPSHLGILSQLPLFEQSTLLPGISTVKLNFSKFGELTQPAGLEVSMANRGISSPQVFPVDLLVKLVLSYCRNWELTAAFLSTRFLCPQHRVFLSGYCLLQPLLSLVYSFDLVCQVQPVPRLCDVLLHSCFSQVSCRCPSRELCTKRRPEAHHFCQVF